VVEQHPVEMLQQYSSVSSCMRMHGGALHWMSAFHAFCSELPYAFFLVFCSTLLTLSWSCVVWIPSSAFLSCPRKQLSSASWQAYFKMKAEAILCILCSSVSIFGTHLAQNLW
jgi:hypothetical protein